MRSRDQLYVEQWCHCMRSWDQLHVEQWRHCMRSVTCVAMVSLHEIVRSVTCGTMGSLHEIMRSVICGTVASQHEISYMWNNGVIAWDQLHVDQWRHCMSSWDPLHVEQWRHCMRSVTCGTMASLHKIMRSVTCGTLGFTAILKSSPLWDQLHVELLSSLRSWSRHVHEVRCMWNYWLDCDLEVITSVRSVTCGTTGLIPILESSCVWDQLHVEILSSLTSWYRDVYQNKLHVELASLTSCQLHVELLASQFHGSLETYMFHWHLAVVLCIEISYMLKWLLRWRLGVVACVFRPCTFGITFVRVMCSVHVIRAKCPDCCAFGNVTACRQRFPTFLLLVALWHVMWPAVRGIFSHNTNVLAWGVWCSNLCHYDLNLTCSETCGMLVPKNTTCNVVRDVLLPRHEDPDV